MARNISFDELIVKISAAHIIVDEAVKPALEDAAQKVKETAEQKFGTYQPSFGSQFPAWAALSSDYLAEKIRKGGGDTPLIGVPSMNKVYGTPLRESIEYTVTATEAHIGTDDILAPWHEFGALRPANTLPARPFLRPALHQNEGTIVKDIGDAIGLALVKYFK